MYEITNNNNFGFNINLDKISESMLGLFLGAVIGFKFKGVNGAIVGAVVGVSCGFITDKQRQEHEIRRIGKENEGKF